MSLCFQHDMFICGECIMVFFLKVSLGWMSVVETAIYSVVGYFDIAALWELRCHMQWLWRFWKSSCFFYDLLEILL